MNTSAAPAPTFTTTVFISDTHGYLAELLACLASLGLVDAAGSWIAGPDVQLVHLGDVVDRGPESVACYRWPRELQLSLAAGQVVRLIGNHDIQYVGGPICGIELEVMNELEALMRADVERGLLTFAHVFDGGADGEWLCVHGGLDAGHERLHALDVHTAAAELNRLGREVVLAGAHHVEIVGVDPGRGGCDMLSGITWCDVNANLRPAEDALRHRQIVGHRIQKAGINRSTGGKLWAINVPYGCAQALVHEAGQGFAVSELVEGVPA